MNGQVCERQLEKMIMIQARGACYAFMQVYEPCHEKRVLMQPCAHLRKTRLKSGHASCIIFHVVQTFAAPAPPPVCRTHKAMRRRDGTCHYLLAALYLKEIRQETAKLQIFLRRASGNCQL